MLSYYVGSIRDIKKGDAFKMICKKCGDMFQKTGKYEMVCPQCKEKTLELMRKNWRKNNKR